ncbi:MAG: biopolymer transporter ExbD [Acidobacteria bacterium]|nr:biopolymer transporter ExbD [Acidobacteriota bacterium]MBI3483652.1 biopolymer transporter ExbD [Acidobacteriota bacterium]
MAYKPKAPPVIATPNVIPMADVMLVMLIIFIVVTPMLQKGVSVELAAVDNPSEMKEADKEDAIVVAVMRGGEIYIGKTKVAKDQITQMVRDQLTGRLDKTVFVKSDGRAHYGVVVGVVDEVRAAGVDQLGLLTEKIKEKAGAPPPPGGGGN